MICTVLPGNFLEIANKISNLSDNISAVVEEVAYGATHQAEETENAIEKLNSNSQH